MSARTVKRTSNRGGKSAGLVPGLRAKVKTVVFQFSSMAAASWISTVRPSPASAAKFHTAGGPAWMEAVFCKFSA